MADSLHRHQNPDAVFFSSSPNPNPQIQAPKRKRGRPRKYGPASLISSSSLPRTTTSTSIPPRKDSANAPFHKKPKLPGSSGHGFMPHVIMVAAGEDVALNVLSFVQQCKRSVCILSAFGSVWNASLSHSGILGGNVMYEGRYEIIMLSGSFLYTESGGSYTRNGGLNICLSGTEGRIVGGGVDGSLVAASPVQVLVGSFVMETVKSLNASSSKDNVLHSPTSLRSLQEASIGTTVNERNSDGLSYGAGGGNNYMDQAQAISMVPSSLSTDWSGRQVSMHGKSQFIPDDDDD